MSFLNNVDLGGNQLLQAVAQVLGTDPVTLLNEGRFWVNSTTHKFYVRLNGVTVSFYADTTTLDAITAPAADVSLNSHKITNLATPTGSADAVRKDYVDNLVQGLSWKDSVRAKTTANHGLSGLSAFDGVTPIAGDRILVASQTAPAENGIYDAAAGAWARSGDANTAAELENASVFVDEGTAGAGTLWNQTAEIVTLGTTGVVWVQIGAGTTPTAGAGLAFASNTYDVNVDGSSIEINADTLRVKALGIAGSMLAAGAVTDAKVTDVAVGKLTGTLGLGAGGTGQTTAAAARTALGTASVFAADITGDGSTTAFAVTHSLGTKDVVCQIWEVSTDAEVFVDKVRTSTSVVTVTFAVAPVNAKVYRAVIFAKA